MCMCEIGYMHSCKIAAKMCDVYVCVCRASRESVSVHVVCRGGSKDADCNSSNDQSEGPSISNKKLTRALRSVVASRFPRDRRGRRRRRRRWRGGGRKKERGVRGDGGGGGGGGLCDCVSLFFFFSFFFLFFFFSLLIGTTSTSITSISFRRYY